MTLPGQVPIGISIAGCWVWSEALLSVSAIPAIAATLFLSFAADGEMARSDLHFSGCYKVEASKWDPPIGPEELYLTPPQNMRLGKDRAKWLGAEGLAVYDRPNNKNEVSLQAYWTQNGQGVTVVFSQIISGYMMVLNPTENGFAGIARTYWDTGRPENEARVVATRMPCWRPGS